MIEFVAYRFLVLEVSVVVGSIKEMTDILEHHVGALQTRLFRSDPCIPGLDIPVSPESSFRWVCICLQFRLWDREPERRRRR